MTGRRTSWNREARLLGGKVRQECVCRGDCGNEGMAGIDWRDWDRTDHGRSEFSKCPKEEEAGGEEVFAAFHVDEAVEVEGRCWAGWIVPFLGVRLATGRGVG